MCRIQSLSEYVEKISSIELANARDTFTPPQLLFRGHSNINYNLVPSIGRIPTERTLNSWQMVEKHMIQTAQQKLPLFFNETSWPTILLAKLQHYGIMTRMLDLTENALVALYFACNNHDDIDGEVIVFSASPVSAYNRYANAIADTYRLTGNSYMSAESYFFKATKQSYFSDFLSIEGHFKDDAKEFEERIAEPFFIEVGNVSERQKNQGGYFILFPNKIENGKLPSFTSYDGSLTSNYITQFLVTMEKDDKSIIERITIPKEIKHILLEQLGRFGISDEFIFPDSVDKVCKSIVEKHKRYY